MPGDFHPVVLAADISNVALQVTLCDDHCIHCYIAPCF